MVLKYRTLTLLMLAAALSLLMMATAAGQNTGYMGEIWRWGVSARARALGGAFLALADDPSGLFFNPAALMGQRNEKELTLLDFSNLNQISHLWQAGYSNSHPDRSWGVAATYFGANDFEERGKNDEYLGNFGFSQLALAIGYARKRDFGTATLDYGASLKFDGFLFAGAKRLIPMIDVGGQLRYSERLSFALAAQNLFATYFAQSKYPVLYRLGFCGTLGTLDATKLNLLGDLDLDSKWCFKFTPGLEFDMHLLDNTYFSLRGSFDPIGKKSSLGCGFTIPGNLECNIAFEFAPDPFPVTYCFSFSWKLGKAKNSQYYLDLGMKSYRKPEANDSTQMFLSKKHLLRVIRRGQKDLVEKAAIALILLVDKENGIKYMEHTNCLPTCKEMLEDSFIDKIP